MIGYRTLTRTLEARGVKLRASGPKLDCLQVVCNRGDISHREKKLIEKYTPEILNILKERAAYRYLFDNTDSIIHGDSAEVLKKLPENSFDQLVIDPNYGIGFMGKDWDKSVPDIKLFKQCLRVLKPGAWGFFMCSPRQDVLAQMLINLKQAGFLVNFPSIYWTYATGFLKARNLSKAIDKKNGTKGKDLEGAYAGFEPKPAVEVILVAMKPLAEKNYTEQALANGKGCTWLDDCRIPYVDESIPSRDLIKQKSSTSNQVIASQGDEWQGNPVGRMPANLLVSEDVLYDGNYSRFFSLDAWAERNFPFFKVSKASRKEKEFGLNELDTKSFNDGKTKVTGNHAQWGDTPRKNIHPTVKPVKLIAYLISLGSRPGDLIGDFAAGSGTTCVAAKLLGRKFIGIEKEEEYHEIAKARVENASLDVPVLKRAVADIRKHEESREQQPNDAPAKAPKPCFFSNMTEEQLKELDDVN
jgi:DNA modification methylase